MIRVKPAAAYSFKLNITVLNLIGLYSLKSDSKLYTLYSYGLFILALVPTAVLGTLHFIFDGNLANIDYGDFIMVGIMFYTFKLMPFVIFSDKIKKCIYYIDNKPYTVLKREEKILEECVNNCRRNTNVFFAGCVVGFSGFFGKLFLQKDLIQLPINVWFPYTNEERPVLYYFTYFLLVLGGAYSVFACGTIDPMVAGLAYHAATHLRILKNNLQYLDEYVNEKLKTKLLGTSKSYMFYEEIKVCVRRYQVIVEFVSLFKICFSQLVFSQFVGSVFVIGLCCLQVSRMSHLDFDFIITVICLGVLLFQLFFYCYYGTLLVEENKVLSTAIYMSNWYDYSIKEKKALIILIERSKKPMILNAGKVLDLSLDTFTMILKRSYSLLAVLNNYQ